MDAKNYQFWADFFRQAAEGQARFDEVRKWMEQGIQSSGGMYEIFRKWFEATTGKPVGQPAEFYEDVMAEFNRAIQQFLNDFGVIPKSVYQDLEEKNRALKQRIEEQEETIRRLRRMLADKEVGLGDSADQFTRLVSSQQELFKQWVDMFSASGNKPDKESEKKE